METKALKRQMGAAIAMVLVAAIALAASTYAWFVSNNQVKATTASVSAQSNSPFLKIAKVGEDLTDSMATQVAGEGVNTNLYPSQWANVMDSNTYQFESAYGKSASEATILDNSRFAVGGVDATARPKYALEQSFDIGTTEANAGSFKDLKVSSVSVNAGGDNSAGLKKALCILVKCGNQWAVYKADNANGTLLTQYGTEGNTEARTSITNNVLANDAIAATIAAGGKVTVDVYVFYDGSASTVYTNNQANLNNCGVTVTFSATPVNTEGNEIKADSNFVDTTQQTNAVTGAEGGTTGGQGGNDVAGKVEGPTA